MPDIMLSPTPKFTMAPGEAGLQSSGVEGALIGPMSAIGASGVMGCGDGAGEGAVGGEGTGVTTRGGGSGGGAEAS